MCVRVCWKLFLHDSHTDGRPRGDDKNDVKPAMKVVEMNVFAAQNASDVFSSYTAGTMSLAWHTTVLLKESTERSARAERMDGENAVLQAG